MTATIPEIIEQLKAHLAALYAVDVGELPSVNAQARHRLQCEAVQKVISALMNEPHEVADEQAHLDAWQAKSDGYLAKLRELESAIAASADVDTVADARLRSAEYQRQWTLKRQLQLLKDGQLIVAPGVSFGTLSAIDLRIAELTARRDRVQAQLDAHLRAAEQILTAEAVTS